jgi:CRISPR-associated protein Cmr2
LELRRLTEQLGNPGVAVVYGGATAIKSYVFESARLPEIRGASALLDRINLVDVPALFGDLESRHCQVLERRGLKALVPCPQCIVYAKGGEVLALAPRTMGPQLVEAIESLYRTETLIAQSVVVWRPCTLLELLYGLDPEVHRFEQARAKAARGGTAILAHMGLENPADARTFGQVVEALSLLRRARREGNPLPEHPTVPVLNLGESLPHGLRCTSCDRRVAVARMPRLENENEQFLCEPCARKRYFGQKAKDDEARTGWWRSTGLHWDPQPCESWAAKFERWLENKGQAGLYFGDRGPAGAQLPPDLATLGQMSEPRGYVGFVYADGNNVGSLLTTLNTPADYSEFSNQLYQALQDAAFAALARAPLPPSRVYPFEVLSIGGDDLFLIVPADRALDLACDISEGLEKQLAALPRFRAQASSRADVHRCKLAENPSTPSSQVALSAGVLIASDSTPIHLAQRLVEQLLKSAKGRARQLKTQGYTGGTIDFLALKSVPMVASDVRDYRERLLSRRSSGSILHLTARPYTVPEMRALLGSAGRLKGAFPASQLYQLRRTVATHGLLQSRLNYLYFSARQREAARSVLVEHLEKVWMQDGSPWSLRRQDGDERHFETVLADLVEILPFVRRLA